MISELDDTTAERVADTMFALATPSRLRILAALQSGPLAVSEIVELVGMEQSAVSHQLRVLRDHAVVSMRRVGRTRQYALRDPHIGALVAEARAHVRLLDQPLTAASDPFADARQAAS
jgi:ArsR family transcriptional regulator, nickel/cobalt-responsive transcriptional repressor